LSSPGRSFLDIVARYFGLVRVSGEGELVLGSLHVQSSAVLVPNAYQVLRPRRPRNCAIQWCAVTVVNYWASKKPSKLPTL